MKRAFYNENGESYTILLGGKPGELSLLVKHSAPDGFDFILCTLDHEMRSWGNGEYFKDLDEAVKKFRERNK